MGKINAEMLLNGIYYSNLGGASLPFGVRPEGR